MTPEEQLRAAALEGAGPPEHKPEPARRLSVRRLAAVVGGVALVTAAVVVQVGSSGADTGGAADRAVVRFAPYVDVTATPAHPFEDPATTGAADAVLAFVVSDPDEPCTPSWGAAYTMDEAARDLDLDRRIARLHQVGGSVTVSFGGVANHEPAIGCEDPADLAETYASVVERYDVDTVDFDVEGSVASGAGVSLRRGRAVATLQREAAADGRDLAVWLTLPIAETGLTDEGLTALDGMLSAGVAVAGVNAMVMDFGAVPAGRSMAEHSELALRALHAQLGTAYAAAGEPLDDDGLWQRVGATPMIGQNDVPAEVFDLEDARALVGFAERHRMRQLSMWSANRDQACGLNYPDVTVVSDECSGVAQAPGEFTSILGSYRPGSDAGPSDGPSEGPAEERSGASPDVSPSASPGGAGAPEGGAGGTPGGEDAVDDPETSPYQVWNPERGYAEGTKVVWHHNVYRAKWFTEGERPDTPVQAEWETPWKLLGPVLPGERPAPTPTMPAGTHPEWRPTQAYVGGDRVLRNGVGYQAKWWTRGDPPDAAYPSSFDSPWRMITRK